MWYKFYMLKKFYSFYMVVVVSIVNRCGLNIDVHHRNLPNKSKVVLYKPLNYFSGHLEQLYINICCYVVLSNEWDSEPGSVDSIKVCLCLALFNNVLVHYK